MVMLTLTLATLDDAATVAMLMTALNETVGPSGVRTAVTENITVTPDQARRRIEAMSATEQVLLAFGDGAPAGLLSLRIVPYLSQDVPYAEVTELIVLTEHRRHGVATLLMAQAEFLARQRDCTAVQVRAWHDNEDARPFYRAAGFEPLEVGFVKYLPPRSSSKRRRAEG
jgi:ribosomal protein S18 acetylase RimI-like enzyme